MVKIIIAVGVLNESDEIGLFGKTTNGKMTLPWNGLSNKIFRNDMECFRNYTWNKTILMGRKTRESIGKDLPGRNNIIISRNSEKGITLHNAITTYPDSIIIGGLNIIYQVINRYPDLITDIRVNLLKLPANIYNNIVSSPDNEIEYVDLIHLKKQLQSFKKSFTVIE